MLEDRYLYLQVKPVTENAKVVEIDQRNERKTAVGGNEAENEIEKTGVGFFITFRNVLPLQNIFMHE